MKGKFSVVADLPFAVWVIASQGIPLANHNWLNRRKAYRGIRRLQPIMYALILPTHVAQMARFVESGRHNRCRCDSFR